MVRPDRKWRRGEQAPWCAERERVAGQHRDRSQIARPIDKEELLAIRGPARCESAFRRYLSFRDLRVRERPHEHFRASGLVGRVHEPAAIRGDVR